MSSNRNVLSEKNTNSNRNHNECGKEQNDALHFLSITCKDKLRIIADETVNFMLISKFKKKNEKWLETNVEAHKTVATLTELKSMQIYDLVSEFYDSRSELSSAQEEIILKNLLRETDKKSLDSRLGTCKREFYELIFKKNSEQRKYNQNNKRSVHEKVQNTESTPVSKSSLNKSKSPCETFEPYEAHSPREMRNGAYAPAQFSGAPIYFGYDHGMAGHQAVALVPIHSSYAPLHRFHNTRSRRPYNSGTRNPYYNNYNHSRPRQSFKSHQTRPFFYGHGCNKSYNNNNEQCCSRDDTQKRSCDRSTSHQQEQYHSPNNDAAFYGGPNKQRTCTVTTESQIMKTLKPCDGITNEKHVHIEQPTTSTISIYDSECVVLVSTETNPDEIHKAVQNEPNKKRNRIEELFGTNDDSDIEICDSGNEPMEKKYVSFIATMLGTTG